SYFKKSAQDPGRTGLKAAVRSFKLDRPTHCKMAIFDGKLAFLLGSPLAQEYFDVTEFQYKPDGTSAQAKRTHAIKELKRDLKRSSRRPIPDVRLIVQGPAVADIDAAFLLHWNEARANDSDQVETPPARPAAVSGGLPVQIVRSLCAGRFSRAAGNDPVVHGE